MSRSRSSQPTAARRRKGRKNRSGKAPQASAQSLDSLANASPTPPPVTTTATTIRRSIPAPALPAPDAPEIEVRESLLDASELDSVGMPVAGVAVDEPEPPSSRLERVSMVVDQAEAAPGSAPSSEAELPWPIERLERFTGSRWRFAATLAVLTILGLLVREREGVVKWLASKPVARHAAAAAVVEEALPASPCPAEMALVERDDAPLGEPGTKVRVCVDRWEASLVEITPEGEERAWSPYLSVDGHVVKAVSKPDVVPQGYIDRDEAQAACESAGKRLCLVEEWVAACEGPEKTQYPYGPTNDDEACNTHGKSPLGELFSATFKEELWDTRVMNDPSLNALDGTVAKTGAFARCTNGFGLHDMVGNLHEWTAERNGVFRGGYYQDVHKNGDGCRYATSAHAPTYHDYSTGFRCCKDAE